MKIGIPRALFYFRYGQFWIHFFKNLGIDIILSPQTNKEILQSGLKKVSSEICLPIKIICGHIEFLKDKVDIIFLPRFLQLNHHLYTCPKMIGIVDIARMQVGNVCKILSPNIKDNFVYAHIETGFKLTKNPIKTIKALNKALPYLTNHQTIPKNNNHQNAKILLLSHFYNLSDDFISKDIITAFQVNKFEITTKEDLPDKILNADQGFAKNIRWVYERELYNSFRYNLDKVEGVCNIISFGCGPDSLISEIMMNEATEHQMPFLQLIIDEHTSKTGVNTRIEAFSEIIRRNTNRQTLNPKPQLS
jgi:predicted nucleotide-binding protein (sugar kinase/HSP70/actin superfamily)